MRAISSLHVDFLKPFPYKHAIPIFGVPAGHQGHAYIKESEN